MIPVEIKRQNARERFFIRYALKEIGVNLSLQAKLRLDDGIQLPNIPTMQSLNISDYFASVKTAVSAIKGWRVEPNEISLGFFSFNKYLMHLDLDPKNWENHLDLENHPVLRPLLSKEGFLGGSSLNENQPIDELIDYKNSYQVVEADSSQARAILEANEGNSFVIQGPHGTGKSQTITNILAEAVGNGKKALFVSDKMAALDVVQRIRDVYDVVCAA